MKGAATPKIPATLPQCGALREELNNVVCFSDLAYFFFRKTGHACYEHLSFICKLVKLTCVSQC